MSSKKYNSMLFKGALPALFVLGFIFGLTIKQPAEAISSRTVTGIVIGAATGGVVAGVAGGAPWVPVGIVGGGVVGGLIAKDSRSTYEKLTKKKEHLERRLEKTTSARKKEQLEQKLAEVNHRLNLMERK